VARGLLPVSLPGAHTIGKAPCVAFDDRLWTYDSPSKVDPTLPAWFAKSLKKECPGPGLVTRVDLEVVTPTKFDTQYYKNLQNSLGLLTSDQSMWEDSRTKGQVESNIDSHTFTSNFARAMIALSKIEVLTGNSGEIRRQCSAVN
jgi:peroxidase